MIKPGVHQNIDLRRPKDGIYLGRSERHIIWQLKQLWFISFVTCARFKGSIYYYFFVKPTDKIAESFRIDREILVLVQRYQNFEGRTLDYVDKLMFEYQNRLDKLAFILVSQDEKVKEKVKQLAVQDSESRIIIPYTYDDFFESNAQEIIWDTLKSHFYGRDLFSFESPLQNDTYFFGRNDIVPFLYDKFKTGENSGLFGLRKIGKTSVLYALLRNLSFRNEFGIYIDCQDPSFHKRRWFEALEYLIKKISAKLRNEKDILLDLNKDYVEKNASEYFEEDLKSIQKSIKGEKTLIILDEIENITFNISPTEHWENGEDFIGFWQTIRSVYQNNQGLFSFIVAGVNPMIIESGTVKDYDNPVYRMISPKYLSFFNASEVKDMVSTIGNYMGLEFDDEIFTYLTEDYGGHPFLIRQICSLIHNETSIERPVRVTKYYYQENKERFDRALTDYIELIIQVLNRWYPREYHLLELLSIGDEKKFQESTQGSEKFINHLIGYNLIEFENSKYFIRINAVRQYLKSHSELLKSNQTDEEKWQAVTTLRGRVEIDLKRVILISLKLNYGRVKGKQEFLKIIDSQSKRKERLEALNLEEIFSDAGELYFTDYRKFAVKNWSLFEKVFPDKQLFETYMHMVNAHRIDAHAKKIDDQTYQALIISLNWLDKNLREFVKGIG